MSAIDDDTEWLLRQWALWSVTNTGIKLKYPSIEPFTKMVSISGGEPVLITDDEAATIDKIVANLIDNFKDEGMLLFMYYRNKRNLSFVSKKMGLPMRRAEKMLSFGIGRVGGMIFNRAA
jgi:hypothetical protein